MRSKLLFTLVTIIGVLAIYVNFMGNSKEILNTNSKATNAFAKEAYVKFARYGRENPNYIKLYQSKPISTTKNYKFKLTPDDIQNENHLLQHFDGYFDLVVVCDGKAEVQLADLNSRWIRSDKFYFDTPLNCGKNVSASKTVIHTSVDSWKMQIEIEVKGNYDYFSYAIYKTPKLEVIYPSND